MKEDIIKTIGTFIKENRTLNFNDVMLKMRPVLWELADKYGVEGSDIFIIFMDNYKEYEEWRNRDE